jgi:hypothetical protein
MATIKKLPKWQPLAIAKSPPILVHQNIACACRSVSRTIVSKHLLRCNDNKMIQGLQIRIKRRMKRPTAVCWKQHSTESNSRAARPFFCVWTYDE